MVTTDQRVDVLPPSDAICQPARHILTSRAEAKTEESAILLLARFSPGNQTFDPFTTS